ncbi:MULTISPECIES: DMT family transporter [unclassified Streptomyces]|uniref:DMT family transporter n=1 Tax=unclassified Streptomyces TaxID=2593676 RepID=UPI00278C1F70|nr:MULTISPECIES: DMT family transporter [unclassified Streptomyces]
MIKRTGVPMRSRALVGMGVGALSLSVAPVLIDLSGTSPGTASYLRCALALPLLALLCAPERRREGPPGARHLALAALAGALFAGDMLLWTAAIGEVGAGLSTVLVNVQVVLVPLLAWLVDGERVTRRFLLWLGPLVVGVALTGGVLSDAVGDEPLLGTVHALLAALCYSGFLFLLRRGGLSGRVRQTYLTVTASAGLVSLGVGALWSGVTFAPGWAALGWLAGASLTSGVIGWLLVAVHSPRLASHVGAVLLLLTPAGALACGAAVLGERPTPLQLAGCALLLASGYFAVRTSTTDDA